jgi:hypothetical protein
VLRALVRIQRGLPVDSRRPEVRHARRLLVRTMAGHHQSTLAHTVHDEFVVVRRRPLTQRAMMLVIHHQLCAFRERVRAANPDFKFTASPTGRMSGWDELPPPHDIPRPLTAAQRELRARMKRTSFVNYPIQSMGSNALFEGLKPRKRED